MTGITPPCPTGSEREATFMRAVWERLWGGQSRVIATPGAIVNATTRGFSITPTARGNTSGATVRVLLCDPETGEAKYYLMAGRVDPDQTA